MIPLRTSTFAIANVAVMIVTGWCSCVVNAIVIMLAKVDGYGWQFEGTTIFLHILSVAYRRLYRVACSLTMCWWSAVDTTSSEV